MKRKTKKDKMSSKSYKVWIEIEEYDNETEEGTDVTMESTAEFTSQTAAIRFANRLQQIGEQVASDYVEDLVSI